MSPRAQRVVRALADASAIPLARRRTIAMVYGVLRRAGMRPAAALESVARRFGLPLDVLRPALFGGVWDCGTCRRQSYRLPGALIVYRNGQPAEPCCLQSRGERRAA